VVESTIMVLLFWVQYRQNSGWTHRSCDDSLTSWKGKLISGSLGPQDNGSVAVLHSSWLLPLLISSRRSSSVIIVVVCASAIKKCMQGLICWTKELIESKREIKESDKKQPTLLLYMFDTFVMYNFFMWTSS
jgi:hypothetical protein